jgi:hypothetical protein
MSKLLATLVAGLFSAAVFAQATPATPATPAPAAAKAAAAAPGREGPPPRRQEGSQGRSQAADKKEAKADAKAEKKAEAKTEAKAEKKEAKADKKKAAKADAKAEKKAEEEEVVIPIASATLKARPPAGFFFWRAGVCQPDRLSGRHVPLRMGLPVVDREEQFHKSGQP